MTKQKMRFLILFFLCLVLTFCLGFAVCWFSPGVGAQSAANPLCRKRHQPFPAVSAPPALPAGLLLCLWCLLRPEQGGDGNAQHLGQAVQLDVGHRPLLVLDAGDGAPADVNGHGFQPVGQAIGSYL